MVLEHQWNNGGATLTRWYVRGRDLSETRDGAGGVGGMIRFATNEPGYGVHHHVAYDGNGNVSALVRGFNGSVASRTTYDPFGQTLTHAEGPPAPNCPVEFSTKFTDAESGLIDYGFRVYAPEVGAWLARDPIGELDHFALYTFIKNSPLSKYDPNGLFSCNSVCTDWCLPMKEGKSREYCINGCRHWQKSNCGEIKVPEMPIDNSSTSITGSGFLGLGGIFTYSFGSCCKHNTRINYKTVEKCYGVGLGAFGGGISSSIPPAIPGPLWPPSADCPPSDQSYFKTILIGGKGLSGGVSLGGNGFHVGLGGGTGFTFATVWCFLEVINQKEDGCCGGGF